MNIKTYRAFNESLPRFFGMEKETKSLAWPATAEFYGWVFIFSSIQLCTVVFLTVRFNGFKVGREYAVFTFAGMSFNCFLLPIKMGLLSGHWTLPRDFCAILLYIDDFSAYFSSWSLVFMAIERINYFCYSTPLLNENSKALAKVCFPIVWVVSGVQALQMLNNYKATALQDETGQCFLAFLRSGHDMWLMLVYSVVIPVMLVFFYLYSKNFMLLKDELSSVTTYLCIYLLLGTIAHLPKAALSEIESDKIFYGLRDIFMALPVLKVYYISAMAYCMACDDHTVPVRLCSIWLVNLCKKCFSCTRREKGSDLEVGIKMLK